MITKQEVDDFLAPLKEYCKSQYQEDNDTEDAEEERELYIKAMEDAFIPLENAVDKYFKYDKTAMSEALEELAEAMFNDTKTRQLKFEERNQVLPEFGISTDIEDCFYKFSWLSTPTQEFFDNITIIKSMGSEGDSEEDNGENSVTFVVESKFLDKWTAELNSHSDMGNISNLIAECRKSASKGYCFAIMEDTGKVVSSIEKHECAKIVYNDRHLLNIIESRGLSTFVPSYIRG